MSQKHIVLFFPRCFTIVSHQPSASKTVFSFTFTGKCAFLTPKMKVSLWTFLFFLGCFTQIPYCFPMCFLLTVGSSVTEGINHSAFFHDACVWLTQYSLWASWGWEPHLIHLYVKWIYCVPWHSKRLSNKGSRWHNKPFLPRFLRLSFCRWSLL